MLSALLGLISLGFLASSSSALLLPLTLSQVAFRPACGAHRAPAAFTMSAETVEAAEDALAKATATEAKAVSELAAAIAADDDTVGCIVDAENADELAACVNQGIVFTLEESGDGWDDVRRGVIDAKKERSKAVDELKTKYGPGLASAGRWAKVITNEVVKVAPKVSPPDLSGVKGIKLEGKSVGEVAKNAVFGFLDAAAANKSAQKEKQAKQEQKLKAEAKNRKKNF